MRSTVFGLVIYYVMGHNLVLEVEEEIEIELPMSLNGTNADADGTPPSSTIPRAPRCPCDNN